MRLATWNVNSIRARVDRIVDFAVREHIDVLAMQEIKCKPEQFPYGPFEEAGYHVEVHRLHTRTPSTIRPSARASSGASGPSCPLAKPGIPSKDVRTSLTGRRLAIATPFH